MYFSCVFKHCLEFLKRSAVWGRANMPSRIFISKSNNFGCMCKILAPMKIVLNSLILDILAIIQINSCVPNWDSQCLFVLWNRWPPTHRREDSLLVDTQDGSGWKQVLEEHTTWFRTLARMKGKRNIYNWLGSQGRKLLIFIMDQM